MKTRTITLLTITLAVLACIYYLDSKRKLQRWTERVEQGRLLPFPLDKLDRLEAAGPSGRFVLERRPDGWWITSPVEEKADQKTVTQRILGVLEKASKFGAMPITENERRQYGLVENAVKITAVSGGQSVELTLGARSPIESEIYLCDQSRPLTVYVTQDAVRKAFDRPLLDLRDKRVLDFEAAQAPSLSIQRGETHILFRKAEDGAWMTAKQAVGCRLEAVGTEKQAGDLRLETGGTEKQAGDLRLETGGTEINEPAASSLKPQVSKEPQASSLKPQASKEPQASSLKSQVSKEPQASSLKPQASKEPQASSLKSQASKWVRADARAVERILQAVAGMMPLTDKESAGLTVPPLEQASAVLRIAKAAQPASSARPEEAVIAFHLLPEDKVTSVALSLGGGARSGVRPAVWFAAIQGRNLLFKAPPALVVLLSFSPESFRDRLVFSLEAAAVCYLQIEWTIGTISSSVALSREPEGPWVFAADPETPVNQDSVSKYVVFCLGQEMASEKPSTATLGAGFEKPILRVSLANKDRSKREGFEIGNPVAKGGAVYFARRTGSPGPQPDNAEVFALQIAPSLEDFIKSRESFVDRSVIPFEPSATARIEMIVTDREQKTSLTLTREAGGAQTWRGTLGQAAPKALPGNLVEPFLTALRGMQYITEAREVDDALLKKHGLDSPQLTVRLYDRAGGEVAALFFGQPVAKDVILVRRGSGQCFYVASEALSNFAQALGALVSRMK
jgi:hypothetical protein